MNEEKDEIVVEMPDNKNIPCRTCIFGQHNYLAMYCAKYKHKPADVYYQNGDCPFYTPLTKQEK